MPYYVVRLVNVDDLRFLACFASWGSCFVTIDRGAKNRIAGASATPERKEHKIQGPTTSLYYQREQLGLLLYFSFSVVAQKRARALCVDRARELQGLHGRNSQFTYICHTMQHSSTVAMHS